MTGREDVIRVVLCAAYMLLLTYSREVVVLGGGPAGLVRDRARRTVDPEVWTWQLIRESRWRFAGLMEDSPTLLGRIRLSSVGEAPFVFGDSHDLGLEACVYCSGGRPKLVNACGGRPRVVVGVGGRRGILRWHGFMCRAQVFALIR